jgi:hypothetical protein
VFLDLGEAVGGGQHPIPRLLGLDGQGLHPSKGMYTRSVSEVKGRHVSFSMRAQIQDVRKHSPPSPLTLPEPPLQSYYMYFIYVWYNLWVAV